MTASIQERLFNRLEKAPDSRAIAYYEPKEQLQWLTYAQLYGEASQIAAHLAEKD